MQARAFGPAPAGRPERLAAHARAVVAAWLKDWSLTPEPLLEELDVRPGAPWTASPEDSRSLGEGDDQVAMAVDTSVLTHIAGCLAGVEADADPSLARDIGEGAITDLLGRMLAVPRSMIEGASAAALAASFEGVVYLDVHVGGLTLPLGLSRSACKRLDPLPRRDPETLVRPEGAIAEQGAMLNVELDLGELALSSLSGLKPGDVIVTCAPLDTPFTLRAGDGARLPHTCRLARSGAHLAVFVESGG